MMSEDDTIDFIDDGISISVQTEGFRKLNLEIDGETLEGINDCSSLKRDIQQIDFKDDFTIPAQTEGRPGKMNEVIDDKIKKDISNFSSMQCDIPQIDFLNNLTISVQNESRPNKMSQESNEKIKESINDWSSMQSDIQQIASFHQGSNRAETREYEAFKMAIDKSSEKPDIDMITYSKLSGR